jgi:hypothetical protein
MVKEFSGIPTSRERIKGAIHNAWLQLAGMISPRHRLEADFFGALERGEGATVYTWQWDGEADYDSDVDGLLDCVDETIRQAPSPFGIDEALLRVLVYGPRLEDHIAVEETREGRELLRRESLYIDRLRDWKRGNGRSRLGELLRQNKPSPQTPLVAVAVYPLGEATAALLRGGRWRPACQWLR